MLSKLIYSRPPKSDKTSPKQISGCAPGDISHAYAITDEDDDTATTDRQMMQ